MARSTQDLSNPETCTRCQGFLQEGQETCPACHAPTRFMSFKARAEYEVEQWRQYKGQNAAAS